MEARAYVAGWDGGGTKTTLEVRDPEGAVLGRAGAGALNPNGGAAGQTEQTVAALLAEMERIGGPLAQCRGLCVGAAGVSNPETGRLLHAALEKGGWNGPLRLAGDHETALYGALGRGEGAILIAGTGSICFGRAADGRQRRCGGWGHLLDDGGSGYAVGRDILAAVVRAEDGRAPATCLRGPALEAVGAKDVPGLIRFVYSPATGKRKIAALARLLEPALEAGDEAAKAIARRAAEQLAELAGPVVEGLSLQEGELALLGGVLTGCGPVRDRLKALLAARWPGLRVIPPRMDAAAGATLLALELYEKRA